MYNVHSLAYSANNVAENTDITSAITPADLESFDIVGLEINCSAAAKIELNDVDAIICAPARKFLKSLDTRRNDVFRCTERDARFARDVRLRRMMCPWAWAEYITSLCGFASKHHYAARHNITCPSGQTSLFGNYI